MVPPWRCRPSPPTYQPAARRWCWRPPTFTWTGGYFDIDAGYGFNTRANLNTVNGTSNEALAGVIRPTNVQAAARQLHRRRRIRPADGERSERLQVERGDDRG